MNTNNMEARLLECHDELKRLYGELYGGDEAAFAYFIEMLRRAYADRKPALRALDEKRLAGPDWYRGEGLLGMMLYVDAFAGNLNGVAEKLDYLEECGVNYLHLMPLLKTVKNRSDGGYAVADFRTVEPSLGTMDDLEALADTCRERGISLCLDFVMNHTSEEHPWAKAARAGDPTARSRYFFFDNWDIPNEYEKTVPQVFPTTAPGNFTWLDDCRKVVMTFFHPYQWDLNYANPMVFNDMTENLLFLTNRGVDVIRLDAIPYIWKQLGTDCRNLPQVHTLARLLNLACHIVCPGVLLLGEVVMEPQKLAPYFGSPERPECHILYNATTMCTTWHTLATRDVRLLRRQMEQVCALPRAYSFQNYLRCHDDIGWGLDYPWLWEHLGQGEVPHKRYLNDWFSGVFPGSWARGELYNDDPRLGDARMCGTTASLCGLESAATPEERQRALDCDVMLHAWMLTQSGIPVIYSGDELGRLNDYTYHDDPEKQEDSRYVHRGRFPWEDAERRNAPQTPQGHIFRALRELEQLRAAHPVFRADAETDVFDTGSDQILGFRRRYGTERLTALFNFSEHPRWILNPARGDTELRSGAAWGDEWIELRGYGFVWLYGVETEDGAENGAKDETEDGAENCAAAETEQMGDSDMREPFDVVALGELLIDFTENGQSEQANPLFEANPGGAPCNVLAMLQKLGHRTAFIGKVGDDLFGRGLRDTAQSVGIDVSGLVLDGAAHTTLAFVHTFENGDRDFSFYRDPGADMLLREDELPVDMLRNARIFHFGTLSMTHDGVRAATKKAVAIAKESGALISFDPNLRPPLWGSLDDAKAQIEWGLSQCDILKIADNELEFMTGETMTGKADFERGAAMLRERYPNIKILNVTAGADGSYSFFGGRHVFVPSFRLGGTIETTGAGDTFCACVLHYALDHGADDLTEAQRLEMLRFANAAAYLVTTKKGAIRSMPEPEQVEAVLNRE